MSLLFTFIIPILSPNPSGEEWESSSVVLSCQIWLNHDTDPAQSKISFTTVQLFDWQNFRICYWKCDEIYWSLKEKKKTINNPLTQALFSDIQVVHSFQNATFTIELIKLKRYYNWYAYYNKKFPSSCLGEGNIIRAPQGCVLGKSSCLFFSTLHMILIRDNKRKFSLIPHLQRHFMTGVRLRSLWIKINTVVRFICNQTRLKLS